MFHCNCRFQIVIVQILSNKVMSGLHKGAVYEELASVRLVGMMLTVAVKKSLRDQISDCLTAAVGTGTLKWVNVLKTFYQLT